MGLQETDEIDIISYNNDNGIVTFGIIDTMDWNDIDEHLMLLQEKLNVYLSFLESGEVYSHYEAANGSEFEIKVYFKNNFPQSAKYFMKHVSDIINSAGYNFSYEIGF